MTKLKRFEFKTGTPGNNPWLQVVHVVVHCYEKGDENTGACKFKNVVSLEYDDLLDSSVETYPGCVIRVGPMTTTIETSNEDAKRELREAITALDATGWNTDAAISWMKTR